ncbi:MAG: hypothetical protein JKY37_20365 [Nannocystaceae bacterium]|nr:hypothetical protein [Nannocystaceae bacterium]
MRLHLFGAIALGTAALACTNSDADPNTVADDGGSTGTDSQTTIPLTTVSGDGGPGATITDTTAGATSTGTDTAGSSSSGGATTSAGTADGSSSGDTNGDSDTSGSSGSSGGEMFDVEWCILQFPAEITTTTDVATTVYARLYVQGVTDQTEFVDEHPAVIVEFGYGADDTLPDAGWSWFAGAPNPGWDGSMAGGGIGSENNDEYQSELSFSATGSYDYAARVSGDSGATWVHCDLDGLVEGGYTTDQAGQATVED